MGLRGTNVRIVPVALTLEAQDCLILHDIGFVLPEDLVQVLLRNLLLLAIGGLMTDVSAPVAPHAEHWLLVRKQVLSCDRSHCIFVGPIILGREVCKGPESEIIVTDDCLEVLELALGAFRAKSDEVVDAYHLFVVEEPA